MDDIDILFNMDSDLDIDPDFPLPQGSPPSSPFNIPLMHDLNTPTSDPFIESCIGVEQFRHQFFDSVPLPDDFESEDEVHNVDPTDEVWVDQQNFIREQTPTTYNKSTLPKTEFLSSSTPVHESNSNTPSIDSLTTPSATLTPCIQPLKTPPATCPSEFSPIPTANLSHIATDPVQTGTAMQPTCTSSHTVIPTPVHIIANVNAVSSSSAVPSVGGGVVQAEASTGSAVAPIEKAASAFTYDGSTGVGHCQHSTWNSETVPVISRASSVLNMKSEAKPGTFQTSIASPALQSGMKKLLDAVDWVQEQSQRNITSTKSSRKSSGAAVLDDSAHPSTTQTSTLAQENSYKDMHAPIRDHITTAVTSTPSSTPLVHPLGPVTTSTSAPVSARAPHAATLRAVIPDEATTTAPPRSPVPIVPSTAPLPSATVPTPTHAFGPYSSHIDHQVKSIPSVISTNPTQDTGRGTILTELKKEPTPSNRHQSRKRHGIESAMSGSLKPLATTLKLPSPAQILSGPHSSLASEHTSEYLSTAERGVVRKATAALAVNSNYSCPPLPHSAPTKNSTVIFERTSRSTYAVAQSSGQFRSMSCLTSAHFATCKNLNGEPERTCTDQSNNVSPGKCAVGMQTHAFIPSTKNTANAKAVKHTEENAPLTISKATKIRRISIGKKMDDKHDSRREKGINKSPSEAVAASTKKSGTDTLAPGLKIRPNIDFSTTGLPTKSGLQVSSKHSNTSAIPEPTKTNWDFPPKDLQNSTIVAAVQPSEGMKTHPPSEVRDGNDNSASAPVKVKRGRGRPRKSTIEKAAKIVPRLKGVTQNVPIGKPGVDYTKRKGNTAMTVEDIETSTGLQKRPTTSTVNKSIRVLPVATDRKTKTKTKIHTSKKAIRIAPRPKVTRSENFQNMANSQMEERNGNVTRNPDTSNIIDLTAADPSASGHMQLTYQSTPLPPTADKPESEKIYTGSIQATHIGRLSSDNAFVNNVAYKPLSKEKNHIIHTSSKVVSPGIEAPATTRSEVSTGMGTQIFCSRSGETRPATDNAEHFTTENALRFPSMPLSTPRAQDKGVRASTNVSKLDDPAQSKEIGKTLATEEERLSISQRVSRRRRLCTSHSETIEDDNFRQYSAKDESLPGAVLTIENMLESDRRSRARRAMAGKRIRTQLHASERLASPTRNATVPGRPSDFNCATGLSNVHSGRTDGAPSDTSNCPSFPLSAETVQISDTNFTPVREPGNRK